MITNKGEQVVSSPMFKNKLKIGIGHSEDIKYQ